jgi:hypothetical protein
MSNFEEVFSDTVELYRKDLQEGIKQKFHYFPLCAHGRVPKKKYYSDSDSCFALDKKLVKNKIQFLEQL